MQFVDSDRVRKRTRID